MKIETASAIIGNAVNDAGSAACAGLLGMCIDSAAAWIPDRLPVTAHHYFGAPTGSDTNPGTSAAPFKTIARAARAALPGTTVYVAPGTYAGGFKTTASGTESARIYFVSIARWGARIPRRPRAGEGPSHKR